MAGVSKMFVSTKFSDQPLFRFTSTPKPAPECKRKKISKRTLNETFLQFRYDDQYYTNNLMSDSRVRRGSYIMDLGPTVDYLHYPCFEMVRKDPLCKLYLKGQKKCSTSKDQSFQATTKRVETQKESRISEGTALYDGRQHATCQTDIYFEELQTEFKHIVQSTQTDPLSDFDASKLGREKIRRAKVGDDKETQISPGELWDFNESVKPIVESLGANIIEQALYELLLEDELASLLDQQQVYENKKKAENDRLARLQARQKEIIDANARSIQQELEYADNSKEATHAVSITMFVRSYLHSLTSNAVDDSRKDGFLKDAQTAGKQDASEIIQWLDEKTTQQFTNIDRMILDDIIQNVASQRPTINSIPE